MSRRPKPLLADQQSPNLLVKLRPAVRGLENNHLTEKMCKRGSVKGSQGGTRNAAFPSVVSCSPLLKGHRVTSQGEPRAGAEEGPAHSGRRKVNIFSRLAQRHGLDYL